jgi:hypothetical protein
MTNKVGLFFRAFSRIYGRTLITTCFEVFGLNFILIDELNHRLTQYHPSRNQKASFFISEGPPQVESKSLLAAPIFKLDYFDGHAVYEYIGAPTSLT